MTHVIRSCVVTSLKFCDWHTDWYTDWQCQCQSEQWECIICHCRQNRFLTKKADKKADSFFQKFESSEINFISFMYILLNLWIYCVEFSIILCLIIFIMLFSIFYEALTTDFTVLISLLSERIICRRWLELSNLCFSEKTQKTFLLSFFKIK